MKNFALRAGARSVCVFTILLLLLAGCGSDSATKASAATPPSVGKTTGDDSSDENKHKVYFDEYVLKAVSLLHEKYRGLGYDIHSVFTHDLDYGTYGVLKGSKSHMTMCVASQLEVILTAMDIYAQETGDHSVYDFLPLKSWQGLSAKDIRGHIWVNERFNSFGTADALTNFGMGEQVQFERLRPGAFINFNRVTGTGHAVTFISFIDKDGNELADYNAATVVGFKYFSAQGKGEPDGGLDYRYGIFEGHECTDMPGKKDCGILLSHDRRVLDSGHMFAPSAWVPAHHAKMLNGTGKQLPDTVFNSSHFDGRTNGSL
jgi:hypothetical protein